jgi:hypothetical protein
MGKTEQTLEELVSKLTPEGREQVRRFTEALVDRAQAGPQGRPDFGWVGALKDLNGRYTSVELQHQVARWRSEGA